MLERGVLASYQWSDKCLEWIAFRLHRNLRRRNNWRTPSELADQSTDSVPQSVDGSFGRLAQKRFQF